MKKTIHELNVTNVGITDLIIHNGRLANPLDEYTILLKKSTSKRNKTEEDYARIADIEFRASLYWDDAVGLHFPAVCIQKMLIDASKRIRRGRQVSGMLCPEPAPIICDGHTKLDAILANKNYKWTVMCVVQNRKVPRTRCKIPAGWKVNYKVLVSTDIIDVETAKEVIQITPSIGMGNWRPACRVPGTYGMFEIEKCEEAK